ncbi:MAG: hypothetical protein J2P46_08685, partial [Zavarzinella sp.]|nr:hypothetical protein [Zavarzinella sp.]
MRRLLRWRLALPVLFLLLALPVFAGWVYTRSEAAAQLVTRKLEERLHTNARFDKLSVGLTSTSVHGLKVYEAGTGTESDPFVAAGEVELDLSALGAAAGDSPQTVRFRDAHVLLRFDRNGDLMTKLPPAESGEGGLPIIRIESGSLTLRQEGRNDSVFHGIDLTVAQQGESVTVTGTVEDQAWGKWTAEGSMPSGGTGRLTLRTVTPHHVTPELLRQVPFVNPNAWTSVELEGTTAAQLDLAINRATDQVTYQLSMQPTETTVTIPTIGLHFTDATGGLTAEGAVVMLTDVRGKSAGGEVLLNSRMDFSRPDSELRFMADLTDMDVKGLPKTWRLPPELDGRLTGKLEFNVTLPAGGGTKVEAAGKATIADARVRGRPVPPIELHVATINGGGVRFTEPQTEPGKHEVLKPNVPGPKLGPPDAKADGGRRPGLVSTFLKFAARLVKPANAPKEEKAYLHLNVAFRDVDVAELLKSAGVDVPVNVAGKVSLQVQLDIPTETPDELKSYRMAGAITSRRVTVDELAIEGLSAKLDLRDGKLAVKDFVGRLPALGENGARGGSFQARGEMEVGKSYPFKASVLLDKVALGHIEQLKNLLPVNVPLAGEATAHANAEGTLSPVAVKTSGDADVRRLRVGSVPADGVTFRWDSDGEAVRFRDVSARLFGGEVSGELDLPVRDAAAGTGALKLQNLDLGEMLKSAMPGSNLKLEGKAAGTVKVRSPAAGEGETRGATAEVE